MPHLKSVSEHIQLHKRYRDAFVLVRDSGSISTAENNASKVPLKFISELFIIGQNKLCEHGDRESGTLAARAHPDRSAVTMQSEQKRCRHSLVVMVFFSMSRQMGHMSSLCRERGDTATSVPSTMAS